MEKPRMPDSPRRSMLDHFFLDKLSESQHSFSPKEQTVSKSKIMTHLRQDNMYHSNAARNIRYIKTNNGGLINYVPVDLPPPPPPPTDRFDSTSSLVFNDVSQISFNGAAMFNNDDEIVTAKPQKPNIIPYDNNHLKVKLGNPESEMRRNFSILQSGTRITN